MTNFMCNNEINSDKKNSVPWKNIYIHLSWEIVLHEQSPVDNGTLLVYEIISWVNHLTFYMF